MITVTVRLIKSFEYRNVRNLVITVDENIKLKDLVYILTNEINKKNLGNLFSNVSLDTFSVHSRAFGAKSGNLVIDPENESFLDFEKTLKESSIEHETEISWFNKNMYEEYQKRPQVRW